MSDELVQEIRDALGCADIWGRLVGRYGHDDDFSRLTRTYMGIECDFSYTTLVTLLDTLIAKNA